MSFDGAERGVWREQLWRRCCRGRANGALNDSAPPLEAVALLTVRRRAIVQIVTSSQDEKR